MKEDTWFSKELKIMILEEVAKTGEPYDLVADKYRIPPMFYMKTDDPNELVEYDDQKMTLAQFHEKYPHRRSVVLRTRK